MECKFWESQWGGWEFGCVVGNMVLNIRLWWWCYWLLHFCFVLGLFAVYREKIRAFVAVPSFAAVSCFLYVDQRGLVHAQRCEREHLRDTSCKRRSAVVFLKSILLVFYISLWTHHFTCGAGTATAAPPSHSTLDGFFELRGMTAAVLLYRKMFGNMPLPPLRRVCA